MPTDKTKRAAGRNRPSVLSAESTEALALRVAQIVLERLPAVQRETISLDEVQVMLNCGSASGTCRTLRALHLRPYLPGKYRRKDIENAIARRSYAARTKTAA